MLSTGQAWLLARRPRRDKLQIVFGLLCNREGCPVAVEVFDGNTADPNTVGVHIEKLRRRFALSRVVLVGDRGMLTEARIREEVAPAGFDWISALRAPAIRELMSSGAVQRSMFEVVVTGETGRRCVGRGLRPRRALRCVSGRDRVPQ